MLLHCAPGGELKDVATGMIIQPKSTTLHTVAMDANVLKVTLGRVLPGCEDMDPPIQPEGADERLTLCQAAEKQHSGGLLRHASPKRVCPG